MKNRPLVIISRVTTGKDQRKDLPSIVSEKSLFNHLLKVVLTLKPASVGYLGLDSLEVKKKGLVKLPEKLKKASLNNILRVIAETLARTSRGITHLVLISQDFFLSNPDLLKKVLEIHARSENDLTLLAERVSRRNQKSSEDYFVYPGLAILKISGQKSWLSKARPFKPTGELDVVSLVEAVWSRERRVGFFWITEQEKNQFIQLRQLGDFSRAAHWIRKFKIEELESRGVFFLSPDSVWLDPEVEIGPGTIVYPFVIIEGATTIGKDCLLYPHCHLINSQIGDRVKIFGATVVENCRIEDEVQVGPFTRLRPETWLRRGSRVGNFVEMKKTEFGEGSKAMHLSYLGDATVEEKVNVGAGTITCNYDGEKKHRTYIEKEAFIGSGTELVAPVRVGRGAYVAAGSTITQDISPESLAIARARQVEKPGWVREKKKKALNRGKKTREKT